MAVECQVENRKNHALNHLKPYSFGASVLKKDDREIRENEIFLDRLTAYPCFVGWWMMRCIAVSLNHPDRRRQGPEPLKTTSKLN